MTNEELQRKVIELERKVQVLEQYIEQKKVQQITFPLDLVSQQIINNL